MIVVRQNWLNRIHQNLDIAHYDQLRGQSVDLQVLRVVKHFQTQRVIETLKYDSDFKYSKFGVKYHI